MDFATKSPVKTILGIDILPNQAKGPQFSAVMVTKKPREYLVHHEHENRFDEESDTHVSIEDSDTKLDVSLSIKEINLYNLIGLIRKKKPDIIAIDNINELSIEKGGIIPFAKKIPQRSTIVQVTGSPREGYQKLKVLSERYGIRQQGLGHPTPLETAEIVARLAALNIGYQVVPFEDEVKIVISKSRGIGKGGWSAPRYERNMKISVSNIDKEISRILTEESLEFDHFIYPKRAVYIVRPDIDSHPYSWFKALCNKFGNDLADIRLSRIPKSSIEFVPLSDKAPSKIPFKTIKSIIIGVDPGTTTGLAVIDIKTGNLILINSFRDFGTSQMVRLISKIGKPLLICTDVIDIPHNVFRLGKIFGGEIFSPKSNSEITRTEKREYVQNFLEKVDRTNERFDSHQRDALFAALKGYQSVEKIIEKTKEFLYSRPDLAKYFDQIINQVISGVHLHAAINEVELKLQSEALQKKIESENNGNNLELIKRELMGIQSKVALLKEALHQSELDRKRTALENIELKNVVHDLKTKLKRKKNDRIQKLDKDRRIEEKLREIVKLKKIIVGKEEEINKAYSTIEILKRFRLIWAKGTKVPIKAITRLQDQELHLVNKELGIHLGDIILLLDPQGGAQITVSKLVEKNIKAVIIPRGFLKRMSHLARKSFEEARVPLLEEEIVTYDPDKSPETRKNKIILFDDLYIADKKYIFRRIAQAEMEYIKKDVEKRKELHQKQSGFLEPVIEQNNQLEILINQYQNSRRGISLVERDYLLYEKTSDEIENLENEEYEEDF